MSGKIRTNGAVAFDLSSLLGTTVDTNSGNKSAGTLRVVIATDQPTLTNALAVTVASLPSHAVTNAGTFVVQENGAALTSLQLIDDTVYTDDTSTHATGTSKGLLMMAAATPTDTAVNANDIGALAMTVNRELMVSLTTALPAGTNGIGKLTANSGVTIGAVEIAASQTIATVTNVTTVATVTAFGTGTTGPMKAEDAAHANGDQGLAVWAVRLDTPVSGANASASADYVPFITDSFGKLWVTGSYAEDLAHTTADPGMFVMAVRSDTLAASSGTTGDYEAFHTDSLGALWTRDTGQLVDDAAFTVATSRVMPLGLMADETSTDSVDEGDIGVPRMTLDRKQIVVPEAHTAGGATPYKLVSAASTNATSVKGSAGQIYSIVVSNVNAAVRYLKLYNKASAPTVGTDTPVQTLVIPGATTGGGLTLSIPVGMEFTTGIAFALTTEATDAGTTGVAASELVVNLTYK